MTSLAQALYDHELVVLRVIGEWWELELTGAEKRQCIEILSRTLNELNLKEEINYLTPEEANALSELIEAGGRIAVAALERRHGEIRQMGPGRLEREEPWLDPISALEALWYRGLIYRGFDQGVEGEMIEYYFLPDELLGQFPKTKFTSSTIQLELNPIDSPPEPGTYISATTDAVDDITTLLAFAQNQPIREEELDHIHPYFFDRNFTRISMLYTLAWDLQLFRATDHGAKPSRHVIDWLKNSREVQLRDLIDSWSRSNWNELLYTPGIRCEGSGWQNDPILARTALLEMIPRQPGWYRFSDLVTYIKKQNPDFQRPDGNYDTWYIRDLESGQFVTGFASWDLVEGRLLRYLITGPMHWLGLTELESVNREEKSFRLTSRAIEWLSDTPPKQEEVSVPLVVHNDATVAVPFNANRHIRFQIARVADADPAQTGKPFFYHLTPTSLARAKEQGIDPDRVLDFMERASGRPIPASTRRGVERWAMHGTEATLDKVVILRVREKGILDKLRSNPKTQPYIAESLGDLAAVVKLEEWVELRRAAASLGLLIDDEALHISNV